MSSLLREIIAQIFPKVEFVHEDPCGNITKSYPQCLRSYFLACQSKATNFMKACLVRVMWFKAEVGANLYWVKWSEVKVAQSCLTLCNPIDYRVHGILQARILEWVAFPFSRAKYGSFSLSISPSNEYTGLIYFKIDWLITLQSKGLSRVFSNTTVQKHQFFGTLLSL